MRLSTKTLWAPVGGLLVLGGIVYASSLLSREDPAPGPEYTVARVTRGDIVRTVSAVGQLSPLISVEVSSQISGLVTELYVDFNSPVRKGQLLARIDSSTYEQQLRQRRADFGAAKANHALAEIHARRIKELYEQDIASLEEHDQAQARLQQTKAALLAAEAAVENARVDVERCSITSPIDGIVIFKQIEIGKTVVSSLSAPTLFTIAPDLSRMKIIAQISEVDVGAVRVGQDVTFTVDAMPEQQFRGTLTQVRNPYTPSDRQQQQAASNSIANFDAVIELENPDGILRPGLTANISIIVEHRENVLQIPNSALRVSLPPGSFERPQGSEKPDGDTATVYRLPQGQRTARPQAVTVALGTTDSIVTEVLSGLDEGDAVVTGVIPAAPERRRQGLFGI